MGPRIREDNGGRLCAGTTEAGVGVGERVPASVFLGASSARGDGDGSPHPRGQRVGALCGNNGGGASGMRGTPGGGEGLLQQRDSSTPLFCARNDIWGAFLGMTMTLNKPPGE